MCPQLMGPVEQTDHGQVEQAALLAIQAGASPDLTPAILGHELLQGRIETIGIGECAIDVLLAEDLFADLQPLLVQVVGHELLRSLRRLKQTMPVLCENPPFGWRWPVTAPHKLGLWNLSTSSPWDPATMGW